MIRNSIKKYKEMKSKEVSKEVVMQNAYNKQQNQNTKGKSK